MGIHCKWDKREEIIFRLYNDDRRAGGVVRVAFNDIRTKGIKWLESGPSYHAVNVDKDK